MLDYITTYTLRFLTSMLIVFPFLDVPNKHFRGFSILDIRRENCCIPTYSSACALWASVVHGRCLSNFWRTRDVRKSVFTSVSAGQSRHKLTLKVLWQGLTSDMTGINADKKVLD